MRIQGKIIEGKQKGRTLGFPTANIKIKKKLESGVYAGEVILDGQKYKAAVFIPQVGNFIEAHILDFSKDIYGKRIEILVGKKIREAMKFKKDEELKEKIKRDIEIIKN